MMMKYILVFCLFMTIPSVICGEVCGKSKYQDAGEIYKPPEAQIVGGLEARPNEFPWQVSLSERKTGQQFCGGIILTKSWIMTAAHCLEYYEETPFDILAVVGEHNMNATNQIRTVHNVDKFIIHEEYSRKTMNNDIALIKVTSAINFSDDVAPVCLPSVDDPYVNRRCFVSGWGYIAFGNTTRERVDPQVLMYSSLNITSNEFCQERISKIIPITENMICAINQRSIACKGDSGGPLTVKDSNKTFSVVGIVSFGLSCSPENPAVYTRVSRYIEWIKDKITKG